MEQPPAEELKRREGSTNPDSKTNYEFPRRLAVCLDGTWNERDSGTNIYHLSNLILEGKIDLPAPTSSDAGLKSKPAQTWVQMVYYDEGVGTGLLDNVSGGAFGIGLSEKVREAYDWLVERYRDGDEVYIFGFSRGAFTARSLVGMIASCGLIYRGAPLPPEQLWSGYQKMAPYPPPLRPDGSRMPPKRWWQPSGAQKPGPFRPLNYLKPDDYPGANRYQSYIPRDKMTETENLLCQWSRRIPIHCLAVFDTVRTLGIEALAIPWLRDRKTEFHKTQLTWLIRSGLHALAIDEHRGNFSHVPWHRKTKLKTSDMGISQRWFIGAHSNIGGSYDNDTLAQLPLGWFVKECSALGLVFKPRRGEPDVRNTTETKDCIPLSSGKDVKTGKAKGHIRDSYTELGGGIWRHLIRAKRNYRRIDPPAEFQDKEEVKSLNEKLDDSVVELIRLNSAEVGSANYNPPNLYEFRKRHGESGLTEPPHNYWENWRTLVCLFGWLAGIALCGVWIASRFVGWKCHWLLAALPLCLAGIAFCVDWYESYLTHKKAANPQDAAAEKLDGWLDLLLNLRLIALALFVAGVGFSIWFLVHFAFFPVPLFEAAWLLAFCAMMMHFNASRMWAAQPMVEAGFGSIVQLQNAWSPAEVDALREAWMKLCLRPTDAAKLGEDHHKPDVHRLLPVYRTIWRDRIGFIPAYAIAFCAGLWVTFSLLDCWPFSACHGQIFWGILSTCSSCWKPAAYIVLIGVVLDYLEDAIHIAYLAKPSKTPGSVRVFVGWSISKLKFLASAVGMAGLAAAILLLGRLQIDHFIAYICAWRADNIEQYVTQTHSASSFTVPWLLAVALALAALYLAFSTIVAFLKPEPKVRCL